MLVVAAAPEELGNIEGFVVGVGPVVAAATMAARLERDRPTGVVLIGTAGAYAGGPPIGSAIVAIKLGLSWGVAALGLGYVPRAPAPIESNAAFVAKIDLPRHNALTVGAVTTDTALAARLADGWTVEHLEAYAVAWACKAANVPFVAVLGIANQVGPHAHVEWLTHRDAAQEATRRAIQPLLRG